MYKLNIIVILGLFFSGTSLEAKKYYSGNFPPVKFFPVKNIQELLNGGPLNLNRAKFVANNQNDSEKFEVNNKTARPEPNNNHPKSSVSDDSVESNENIDNNKVLFAIGSNFSNLAVLVPANLSVLQKSNIHPQHIIGYVPLKTPNGQSIVLPAGAVRVFDTLKNEREINSHNEIETNKIHKEYMRTRAASGVEEDSKPEGREVRRKYQRIRRRNNNKNDDLKRLRRRQNNNSKNYKRHRYGKKKLILKYSYRNKKGRRANKRRVLVIKRRRKSSIN